MDNILASALGEDAAGHAAAEKQQLLSRLLARLAHEIRNPLSSLDIHVQLLEEDLELGAPKLRKEFSSRFDIIHTELHRLDNVVKQFLRLAGPSALELEPVDVQSILSHVSGLVEPELAQRDITIVTHSSKMPTLLCDSGQLTQALLNLIINAVQAIDRSGRIEVSAASAQDFIHISVSDSGPGVPKDKRSAIFEPYFTTKPEGSGLGLWIAQQIALAHGGEILVSNGALGGAVFVLKLPLKPKENLYGQNKD
jgi:signal transduction histidine kinase